MISGVPIGGVKIGVENVIVLPGEAGRGKFVPIPPRYKDLSTSGLIYTVTAPGEQEKNIELTP
jgi:hypothetical protein